MGAALEVFAPDRELAQEYYKASVAEMIGSTECVWDQLINGIYLGTEEWAKDVRRILVSKRRSREHRRPRGGAHPVMAGVHPRQGRPQPDHRGDR